MQVLITGSSSGIGHGLASEFLSRGADVWGISRRNAEDLSTDGHYRHLLLDLTDYEKVRLSIPPFLEGQEGFDLVILNAGMLGPIRWVSELGLDAMKQVMEINVWANKVLLDILLRQLKEVKQVVGISSGASLRSTPGWGPYSMSKAGLNMLMNIYASEYPDTHFTAFAPGLVDSEIQEEIWNIEETDDYPAAKRLQEARYTELMPDARKAAPMLIEGMQKSLEYDSGSFVDVREM
jgi:NAD(P)-dependent dehydrogenase (short-subunit alcohol dehydrogenase family)